MSQRELIIEGARQNNLKNLNLNLPHNKVIAVTGVSGSGKSSLAFDTIFAEGQWRFIESLSTYARLFLEKLDRPDVDSIRNIRPAIALEQKNPVKGSRSTVGTLTELYDLFRVLFAKVATPFCPKCGREIRRWDPSQVVFDLLESHINEKALITFESAESLQSLAGRGFHRILIDDEVIEIEELGSQPSPVGAYGHKPLQTYTVVLDRLAIRDEPRLSDSVETAWREGRESVRIILVETGESGHVIMKPLRFSSKNICDDCGTTVPEPAPILFSFNHPLCACPECKGFGNILKYDEELIVSDKHLSLSEGAIELWERPGYRWWKTQLIKGAKKAGIDIDKPYNQLSDSERSAVFKGNGKFYGVDNFFEELESKRYKLHVRVLLSRFRSPVTCPKCLGKRLCEDALAYKIDGLDIADASLKTIGHLAEWIAGIGLSPMQRDIAKEVLRQISMKLDFLKKVGVDYLTPARQAKTLSGGEYQRVNLSNQLASALTGTLYVLDEPTIGLHPRDTQRIADIMCRLASLGNTIIVVEHDRDIISSGDWVVELGPGGGRLGGEIVFAGPMNEFVQADTLTARYIRGEDTDGPMLPAEKKAATSQSEAVTLHGASGNNLKNITVKFPLGSLTVVSGVSGSGKSSLIVETLFNAVARHFRIDSGPPLPFKRIEGLEKIRGVRLIDQSPIGRTPRSNLLTYLKMFEPIRKLYSRQPEARAHGYTPGFFSFNVPGGRCETCKGEGYQKMEMYFFEDIFVKCEDCKGRRYKEDTLRVTYHGKNINDVLGLTVDEAYEFFSAVPEIYSRMEMLRTIGLGYLVLGQPATTLSGGEAQRLKICAELSRSSSRGLLYILDEPTVGLHHKDVVMLIGIIRRLVESGSTVVIIEHNPDIISRADWVIDLGPEGGDEGGSIVFEGTPDALKQSPHSLTGRYLKEHA
ncbi:MAG TPA: excinuclease ABC subunit UvrA [Dissulfurispiraceae bacterium]|nr:excinuclease ABC subunit UvrA [Dissulfurispiraceae bacterium]